MPAKAEQTTISYRWSDDIRAEGYDGYKADADAPVPGLVTEVQPPLSEDERRRLMEVPIFYHLTDQVDADKPAKAKTIVWTMQRFFETGRDQPSLRAHNNAADMAYVLHASRGLPVVVDYQDGELHMEVRTPEPAQEAAEPASV